MEETVKYMLMDGIAPEGQFVKAHDTDAGYDIKSAEAASLLPGERALLSTGLRVAVPRGYAGIIKSRSGLAVRQGLEAGAGVIDSGYRGQVCVLVHNLSAATVQVNRGDRIAQMCIVRLHDGACQQVDDLDSTDRGTDGFGSTGV